MPVAGKTTPNQVDHPREWTLRERVEELNLIRDEVHEGPDPAATERQHAKGKLTARERIDLLLDEGSFSEVEPLRRHRATGFGLESKKPY
ncbi:carboxyl transferase domain-containing protein, partial [Streptomyces albireticuli]